MAQDKPQAQYEWSQFTGKSDARYNKGDIDKIRHHNIIGGADYEIDFIEHLIHRFMRPIGGKDVLDIGCGGGFLSRNFKKRGFNVTGFDISEAAIALAKSQAPDIDFFVGDGATPVHYFPDKKFDLIIARELHPFSRIDDPGFQLDIVNQCIGLLKKDGVFVLAHAKPYRLQKGPLHPNMNIKTLIRHLGTRDDVEFTGPVFYQFCKAARLWPRTRIGLRLCSAFAGTISEIARLPWLRFVLIQKK